MTRLKPYEEKRLNFTTDVVCECLNKNVNDVMSESQRDEVVFVRHIICYFAHYHWKIGPNAIAKFLGKSQHGTITNGIKQVKNQVQIDTGLLKQIQEISSRLETLKKRTYSRQLSINNLLNENRKQKSC